MPPPGSEDSGWEAASDSPVSGPSEDAEDVEDIEEEGAEDEAEEDEEDWEALEEGGGTLPEEEGDGWEAEETGRDWESDSPWAGKWHPAMTKAQQHSTNAAAFSMSNFRSPLPMKTPHFFSGNAVPKPAAPKIQSFFHYSPTKYRN